MVRQGRALLGALTVVTVGGGLVAPAVTQGAPRAAAKPAPRLTIEVLSGRADLVSAGDVLVRVGVPARARGLRVTAGGKDVTRAFARRADGRVLGRLEDLPAGPTLLVARARGATGAKLTVTNHPNGGPVFSGPQVQPWICQAGAQDAQCNQPPTFTFSYRPRIGAGFRPYDPANPPADVASTTTDEGVTVPFVVRTETGYQNRDQYVISTLFQPGKDWEPWARQPQWNRKLLITHGQSCGIDHGAGTAPDTMNELALSRGFMVMSTALNHAGHNCNVVTQAESLVMAKERIVERYGEIRFTIGTGCSGGSLTQQQVANAYPGVYQGILPQCSFPDAWSTGNQLVDYHLTRRYFEQPQRWGPGVVWEPASMGIVQGHPNYVNSIILDSLYLTALGDPANPCKGVSAAERWSPQNPRGVRCTLADYMVNVLGRRPDGYAGRPLDNVGVQYGLKALRAGTITPAQFVDLNAKIGGADIDVVPTAERTAADEPALRNAHRSGAINDARHLDRVAIIDLRGSDDGAFHDAYRAFSVRARLDREHGDHDNHVIWQGPVPLLGGLDYVDRGILAMDRWLTAVEADDSRRSLADKIAANRPQDVRDTCEILTGVEVPSSACPLVVRVYETPRMVAGESIVTDTNKCALKPLRREDYGGITFSDAQWAQLQAAFPTGVCDFTQRGVSAVGTVPWLDYTDTVGGRPLGAAPRSTVARAPGARAKAKAKPRRRAARRGAQRRA